MFFKITRAMVELPPEYQPVSRQQPEAGGHSQQFQRLRPSVDAYKNHPSLECTPSGASGGQVTGGVQAASAVTPVISPRHMYILHELFLHLFLFEFIYALLPHCTFCHRCSLRLPCGATSFGGHCHLLNQNQKA